MATATQTRLTVSRPSDVRSSGVVNEAARGRIISRAQRGDRDAFSEFYGLYKNTVRRYVEGVVHDEFVAEDVTQLVFIKLMRSIGRYEPGEVPFAAWLRRVSRNVAIDYLRRQHPNAPEGEWPAASGPADDGRLGPEVLEAIAALGRDQRRVVVLRHIVGLSPPEIARLTHSTESSVNSLHYRARRALKQDLCRRHIAPATVRGRMER